MTIATAQDVRRFTVTEMGERLTICEINPLRNFGGASFTRQEAWDIARCQQLPVTFVGLNGTRKNLGVVYDVNVEWKMMKNEAAQTEAAEEHAAYEAEMKAENLTAGFAAFQQKKAAGAQSGEFREGYFVLDGQFIKVMMNRARTKHYARVLDPNTRHWNYAPGLMAQWRRMRDLTPEDAKMFGDLHHYCFAYKCGKELTNPESIERGIGPVCAKKLGWK